MTLVIVDLARSIRTVMDLEIPSLVPDENIDFRLATRSEL